MHYALQTITRKIQRSIGQKGLWATAKRMVSKPLEFAMSGLWECSPQAQRCRREEAEFDRQRHIDTAVHMDTGWMAKIQSANWVHGIGYAPMPIQSARHILASLGIEYERYEFIDYGAGKGRMLFLAAEFPFRRIVGVEYSPDLYQTLHSNLVAYESSLKRCNAIEAVLEDATQFPLPPEPLVLFFHHPFEAPVFRQVMDRIEQSLAESPREVLVIYYDPACRELFDRSVYFQMLRQGDRDPNERYSSNWIVYSSKGGRNEKCKTENAKRKIL
jgi:SAM-dependent methyltransferase